MKKRQKISLPGLLLVSASICWATSACFAQFNAARYVKATSATVTPATVRAGGKATLTVSVTIAPGYHINVNKTSDPNLIPTVFNPKGNSVVTFGKITYPAARTITASYAPKPIQVYSGTSKIVVPIVVKRGAKPGRLVLTGILHLQGCSDKACFPPTDVTVSAPITITGVL